MSMDLPQFIRSLAPEDEASVQLAIERAALLFEVSKHTAKGWLYRARLPRPATAHEIVRRTQGAVTLESIYGKPQ